MKRHIVRATNTVGELWLIYAGLILFAAAGFAWAESMDFGKALWWAIVTATTTGYGDVYPHTAAGQIVAAILLHAAILVVLPLMIGRLISVLIDDQDKFTDAEQREILASLAEIRAASQTRPWVIANPEGRYLALNAAGAVWVADASAATQFWDRRSAESAADKTGRAVQAAD